MNISSNPNPVQYRGTAVNENGIPYYKSNKGTIAGTIVAAPGVLWNLSFFRGNDIPSWVKDAVLKEKDGIAKLEALEKHAKNKKKWIIPSLITLLVTRIGAGMLFDKMRNDKAKKAANDIATGNFQNIYANGGDVGVSPSGIPYYKEANGGKFGAVTGVACGVIGGILSCLISKKIKIGDIAINLITCTLGGMLMGSIAQKVSNKAAEKNTYMA